MQASCTPHTHRLIVVKSQRFIDTQENNVSSFVNSALAVCLPMRPQGSAGQLEARRHLAVARVLEGYEPQEVADFLGADVRSVYRWVADWRRAKAAGLRARAGLGRPPKLTEEQTEAVLSWLDGNPQEFGFATPRWTAPRLAQVIRGEFGVRFHPRYLNDWLQAHGISPQIPRRIARERDEQAISHWLGVVWPAIKKSPPDRGHHSLQ